MVENLRPRMCEWFSFEQIKRTDLSLLQSDPVTFSQGTFTVFVLNVSGNPKKKRLDHVFPAGSNLKIQLRFIDKRLHQLKYIILI